MNYHILIDHWFVDDFIITAEQVDPKNNTFILTLDGPAHHVKSSLAVFAPFGSQALNDIFHKIKSGDRVFVHWFQDAVMSYIDGMPADVPLYLVFWGGDFLSQTKKSSDFNYDPLTREYLRKNSGLRVSKGLIGYAKRMVYEFQQSRTRQAAEQAQVAVRKRFMSRLNYFCHWNHKDLEKVVAEFGGSPKFLQFYYGGGLDQIPGPVHAKQRSTDILVWLGNSDTPANNHLDVFRLLKKFRGRNMMIACPLSYGIGDGSYGNFIDNTGAVFFGERWRSIRKMMALNDYLLLQEDVDIAIMGHNRSQASGNIIAFMKMGKKVYLKEESTIYSLLIEKGMQVFSVSALEQESFEEFSRPLTIEQANENSKLITGLFSDEGKIRGFQRILRD
ncbi:MAG TPA: TDP-N-acetylfucosamine:lipid II N-acetylfucosaminyltransferase [Cyclobacteriaceae bacterium]|nr:TDP-N-acetylfucosamine:lipid II N-acetylfucosaminyltransferase [Cyclobacteriaceae bacterium]